MSSQNTTQQWDSPRRQLISDIPPVHHLPHEVLSRIFYLAIYSVDSDDLNQLWGERRIVSVYRHLYAYLGVCSKWREVLLSSSNLWSLIPVIEYPPGRMMSTPARMSLQRASSHRLHLAAYLENSYDMKSFITEALSRYGHQFDTINLHSLGAQPLCYSFAALAKVLGGTQGSVKELSLCLAESTERISQPPHFLLGPAGTASLNTPSQLQLKCTCLIESLQVLRICGMNLNFEGLSFKNLTEVRLQSLILDNRRALSSFLWSLSSSSNLRTLEIISVVARLSEEEPSVAHKFPLTLPGLQHLYLEDLNIDTLEFILGSISQGSHVVTLNWTNRCCEVITRAAYEVRDVPYEHLSKFKIDTLMLRDDGGTSFNSSNLHILLQAVPTVTTLYLDSVYLESAIFRAMVVPPKPPKGKRFASHIGFPKLKNLYISRSHLHDLAALRNLSKVATSHSLQELGIGIGPHCKCDLFEFCFRTGIYTGPPRFSQGEIDSELGRIWNELRGSVPKLIRLSGSSSGMPPVLGFESRIWQL